MSEQLDCVVERVTFHNADNGFAVLRVRPRGANPGIVTIIGHIGVVAEGERLLADGEWKDDRQHGRQFVAESLRPQPMQGRRT